MKIAYLLTRMDELGGEQIHVRDMSLWMKAQGHEVMVLTGSFGKITDFLESQGVSIHEIPDLEHTIDPSKNWKAFTQIRDSLERLRPDILSCHSAKAGWLGRFAAKVTKVPVIFTAHGWAFADNVPFFKRNIYKILEKISGFFSDHIIAVSQYDYERALKFRIVASNEITMIHNGMPQRPEVIRTIIKDGPTRLIMVARIGSQKDHETLFRALATLKDLSWTLDLVGGGDDTELRDLVIDLNLDDRILFRGEQHDVAEILQKEADLYLLISKWEGFPRSILEAMRSSLPVIASNVGGVNEAVVEGQTGYLAPQGDAEQLSYILRLVIPDKALQIQLGQAGRQKYEGNFTFNAMAAKTSAVYSSVDKKGMTPSVN